MVAESQSDDNVTACDLEILPTLREYYGAADPFVMAVCCSALVAVVATVALYALTVRDVMLRAPSEFKGHTAVVLAIHPVAALIVFLSILVPRANFTVEVVLQGTFVVSLYQFFCLLVAYGGGELELIVRLRPAAFQPVTGPCCCFPCCRLCCPPLDVSKSNMRRIRILVLQLPVVQWLFYMAQLVIMAEDPYAYQREYQWAQVLPIVSLLVALWGANMFISLLSGALAEQRVKAKFLAMQLVVALNALLKAVLKPMAGVLPCSWPLPPAVYCNSTADMVLLAVNVAMATWVRSLYRRDLPKVVLNSCHRLSEASTAPQTPSCRHPSPPSTISREPTSVTAA